MEPDRSRTGSAFRDSVRKDVSPHSAKDRLSVQSRQLITSENWRGRNDACEAGASRAWYWQAPHVRFSQLLQAGWD